MHLDDIVRGDRRDPASMPIRAGLRILSVLYGGAAAFRNALYDRGIRGAAGIPCRVASIGALTAGGTGKTPVVIMTAKLLAEAGTRVAVVSRGYRREGSGTKVVSDRTYILLGPRAAGDEPHLIASSLPGVPVVVGERRADAARLAWDRFGPDIVLLDDGFQHRVLRRDIDIVTLDAERPFGNGNLLPRGLLREPPQSLVRAGGAVFTRCGEGTDREALASLVRRYNPRIETFFSRHIPAGLRNVRDGTVFPPGSLRGRRVVALSAVADPGSFRRMIESLGAEVIHAHPMPDHHRHRPDELLDAARCAAEAGADVVATAKDERNLPDHLPVLPADLLVLDIGVVLEGETGRYRDLVLGAASRAEE